MRQQNMMMRPGDPTSQQQQQQMRAQQMMYMQQQQQNFNPDLMQYDDYYDEEIDPAEVEAYQQMAYMNEAQIPNAPLGQPMDPVLQPAQQLISQGFEIMEEELDEDYEPTTEEIEEYAKYLGMDMGEDRDLFYIAKEGLKAPLPDPWKPCRSPSGSIYYFNFENQELQKEHPCDDYYKKYYINEKGTKRRKKEEKIIKQQIKQQQKQMSSSMGSTGQNPNASGNAANTSLQQMLLMNMSGLDASTSMVNERVQIELEQLMEEYEDKKILYERQRREELKKLEAERAQAKKKIEEEGKKGIEEVKKSNMKGSKLQDKQQRVQSRKSQLQIEKDKRVHELKEQERARSVKQEKQHTTRLEKKREEHKKEEEMRHKLEQDNIKQKFNNKLQIEKDKIREDNNRLLEESGDIDYQVRLFKSDLLESQIDTQKYELEDEYRKKVEDIKQENVGKLQKERERIQNEQSQKLERDREKELRKLKVERGRLEDKKEDLKREQQNKLREEKRALEKTFNDRLRQKKMDFEDELERQREDLKRQVALTFELREERFDKEHNQKREEKKKEQDRYELQVKRKVEEEKEQLEREFQAEFDKEKQVYAKQENEKSETYQSIIKEIQQSKSKLKEGQSKQQVLEKEIRNKQKDCEDLELEKRGKERQLKAKQAQLNDMSTELIEKQLHQEIRMKSEELERIRNMIRDKKLEQELDLKNSQRLTGEFIGSGDDQQQYQKVIKEIDNIKAMILNLHTSDEAQQRQSEQVFVRSRRSKRPQVLLEYTLSEIQAYIELHLPKLKHKKEKFENDRIILRQLIANIERNRMKIRKDLLEGAGHNVLSHPRRIAISGIKDKIDEQARILEEEETKLKDKCDYYRRKEEKLRVMKQKLDIIEGNDRFEDEITDADKKDALFRDLQLDYDKYIKLYQKEEGQKKGRCAAVAKEHLRQQELMLLQHKWSDYLTDEVHDLKPIIGLEQNQDQYQQIFKPYSLHQKYELSDAAYKNKILGFHIYDREFMKMRESRANMKLFLDNQQTWLSKLRQEITYMGVSGVGRPLNRGMVNVASNETLFQLKHSLSHLLSNQAPVMLYPDTHQFY